jgi:hypothetical protein
MVGPPTLDPPIDALEGLRAAAGAFGAGALLITTLGLAFGRSSGGGVSHLPNYQTLSATSAFEGNRTYWRRFSHISWLGTMVNKGRDDCQACTHCSCEFWGGWDVGKRSKTCFWSRSQLL